MKNTKESAELKESAKSAAISTISGTQPLEKSSKETLMENLNKYLPDGYSSNYDDLTKIEENISGLQSQIDQIDELIKPIKKLDRKRGAKPLVTPSERKLLKSTREKLKTQLIIERNNWDKGYQSHRDSTIDEIHRTKNEQLAEQGRSGYYVRKYKGTVVNRVKSFLDNVLEKDPNGLSRFKRNLSNARGNTGLTLIQEFVRQHQENPFLYAFFQSHKDLQERYIQLIKQLLREWNGRRNSNYKFKESEITLTEEI